MRNPFKTLAIELAAQHERRIEELIQELGLTRREVTKQMMVNPLELNPDLLKEVYYLDAYAKIINMSESSKTDLKTAPEFVEELFDKAYAWSQDKDSLMDYFRVNKIHKEIDSTKQDIFQSILLAGLAWNDLEDDPEYAARQPATLDIGGSTILHDSPE